MVPSVGRDFDPANSVRWQHHPFDICIVGRASRLFLCHRKSSDAIKKVQEFKEFKEGAEVFEEHEGERREGILCTNNITIAFGSTNLLGV
jgi:hypothetical protein